MSGAIREIEEALAALDAQAAKCPVNASPQKTFVTCPRCHSRANECCWVSVGAAGAFVEAARASLAKSKGDV